MTGSRSDVVEHGEHHPPVAWRGEEEPPSLWYCLSQRRRGASTPPARQNDRGVPNLCDDAMLRPHHHQSPAAEREKGEGIPLKDRVRQSEAEVTADAYKGNENLAGRGEFHHGAKSRQRQPKAKMAQRRTASTEAERKKNPFLFLLGLPCLPFCASPGQALTTSMEINRPACTIQAWPIP